MYSSKQLLLTSRMIFFVLFLLFMFSMLAQSKRTGKPQ
jgi:hypothetical protein